MSSAAKRKKGGRSQQEQAIALARVKAAQSLQAHRPKVEESKRSYDRTREKRRWQKEQQALLPFLQANPAHSALPIRPALPALPLRSVTLAL